MIKKMLELLGFKQKKQSGLYEFMTSASKEEKEVFLGHVIEQVNEDQRKIIEDANHLGA